jgi:hypothetical protein
MITVIKKAETEIPIFPISIVRKIFLRVSPVNLSIIVPTNKDVTAPIRTYLTNISTIKLIVPVEKPNRDNTRTIKIKMYMRFLILSVLIKIDC